MYQNNETTVQLNKPNITLKKQNHPILDSQRSHGADDDVQHSLPRSLFGS